MCCLPYTVVMAYLLYNYETKSVVQLYYTIVILSPSAAKQECFIVAILLLIC